MRNKRSRQHRKSIVAGIGLAIILLASPQLPGGSAQDEPIQTELLSLYFAPQDVTLWGAGATQRFLVLGKYSDGLERDVTRESHLLLSDPLKGSIDDSGRFVASGTGETVLTAEFGGRQAGTRISIAGSAEKRPFSFAREIGGILTRHSCNNTDCHGGIKGQGGLKLSANVLDPKEDYRWIVQGGTFQVLSAESKGPENPRIDRENPEKSLLLLKPTMAVAHGGSKRLEVGSPDYETLLNWIREGAPYGAENKGKAATIQRVEVFPLQSVLDLNGVQQLLVTAHLSDGRREDITEQVLYVSNDPTVVEVSSDGLVKAVQSGETSILIRAAGHAVSAGVGVIEEPSVDYPKVESRNYIDEFVSAKLRRFNSIPSEQSSDEEFLRRVCLDLTGTLPPPDRVREFLASRKPNKRDELIEILLDSPQYVDYWSFRLSDLMRVTFVSANVPDLTKAYEDWVVDSVTARKSYDQMARERIAAQGYAAPARNFFYVQALMVPEKIMAEEVRVFFGRRLDCAQCHNHPFENWSQNQFWGLTAFYGGMNELRASHVVLDGLGGGHVDRIRKTGLIHPRTKQEVVPTFFDGTTLPEDQWMDPRMELAKWMTSHPYFSEAAVNRIWGYFFGRGIVDPVDDFRTTNPPTHPRLLAALARDFEDHGYDLPHLMRTIVQSKTYQRSGIPNPTNRNDKLNYSRALSRPLEAAVLLDAISSATGAEEDFDYHRMAGGGSPRPRTRAMQMIPDLCPSQFMDVYGRSMRKTPDSGTTAPSLGQALHMWAGPTYTTKISKEGGRLHRLLQEDAPTEKVIEEFYLAALTRFPAEEERVEVSEFIKERASRHRETLEAFVWALISSREFAHNH